MTFLKSSANKASASYDLRRAYKQLLVPGIISLLYLAFLFIYLPTDSLHNIISIAEDSGIKEIPKNFNLCFLTPEANNLGINMGFIGVLFALPNLFLMTKPSVNFHLSLPIDRKTVFKNRIIAAVTVVVAMLVLVLGIQSLINIHYFGGAGFVLKMAAGVFLEAFTYIMASYVIMTIGIFSSYTVIEGIVFGFALIALPTVLLLGWNTLCTAFLNGYSRDFNIIDFLLFEDFYNRPYESSNLGVALAIISPLFFCFVKGADGSITDIFAHANGGLSTSDYYYEMPENTGKDVLRQITTKLPTFNNYIPIIIWLVVIAVLVFLAQRIFVKRKAEKTSIHASNPVATHIFATEFSLGVMWLTWELVTEGTGLDLFTSTVIMLFAFVMANLIVLAISKRQFIFKNKKAYVIPVASCLCIAALSVVFYTGGFGYTSYAPKAEDIKYAVITNAGITDITAAENYRFSDMYPDFNYYLQTLAVIEDKEDIKQLLETKDELVKNRTSSPNWYQEEVDIMYLTNSGKVIKRKYHTTTEAAEKAAIKVINTKTFKEQLKSLIKGESQKTFDEKIKAFGFNADEFISEYYEDVFDLDSYVNSVYKNDVVFVSQFGKHYDDDKAIENTQELRNALAEDLYSASGEQLLSRNEQELCRLKFSNETLNEHNENKRDGYFSGNGRMYIVYPSMKNTVSYLKSKGIIEKDNGYFAEEPVEAWITSVEDYHYYDYHRVNRLIFKGFTSNCVQYDADFEESYERFQDIDVIFNTKVSSKDEIRRLMKCARPTGVLYEDDYFVAFKITVGKNSYMQFMCVSKEDYENR